MKVIDCAQPAERTGKFPALGDFLDRLELLNGSGETQTEQIFIDGLQKYLDKNYAVLRNVTLEGLEVPIPLVLVGPTGLWVIYTSGQKGIYRAREESWEVLNDRTQRFEASRPNLLERTYLMAKAVTAFLAGHGLEVVEVEPVLYLSDPGSHVDPTRPVARIVLSDALERLAASIVQRRQSLATEAVAEVVRVLGGGQPEENALDLFANERDAFSFQDLEPPKPARTVKKIVVDNREPSFFQKIPFTNRQWVILLSLVLVNIVVLAAFVLVILASA